MTSRPVRGIYIWLALLTLFAVFASTAGAREALATRTQAVRQTIAANPPLSRTITVNSTWNSIQGALTSVNDVGPQEAVTPSTISAIGGQLHANFNRGVVSLAPTSADLSLMTTPLNMLPNTLPGTGGTPVKIEITERQPFTDQQLRLVKGQFPVATPAPSTNASTGMPVVVQPGATPIIVNPSTGKPIAGQSGDGTPASQLNGQQGQQNSPFGQQNNGFGQQNNSGFGQQNNGFGQQNNPQNYQPLGGGSGQTQQQQ